MLVRRVRVPHILATGRPFEVVEAVVRRVAIFVVDLMLVVAPGQVEGLRDEDVDAVGLAVDADVNVAVFFGYGGLDDAPRVLEAPERGDLRALVRLPHLAGQHRRLVRLAPPELVAARLRPRFAATSTDVPMIHPQSLRRRALRRIPHPLVGAEQPPLDRLRFLLRARAAVLVRRVRVPDILATGRPFEVVEAVVRRVAIFVVDLILALAPGQVEGLRDEDVDEVVFAVDPDGTVALFVGSGGLDDAPGVLEASEGGDHRVLVRLPDFDGCGHWFWCVGLTIYDSFK